MDKAIELEDGDEVVAACPVGGRVVVVSRRGVIYYVTWSEYRQEWTVEKI